MALKMTRTMSKPSGKPADSARANHEQRAWADPAHEVARWPTPVAAIAKMVSWPRSRFAMLWMATSRVSCVSSLNRTPKEGRLSTRQILPAYKKVK